MAIKSGSNKIFNVLSFIFRTSFPDHYDIWVKPLADGRKAVACFNRASSPQTVILNENTIADLSFEQIYCLDSHLTKSGSDSKELIVKLAPYQCKVYIFGKTD